jgi:hypothetical protein
MSYRDLLEVRNCYAALRELVMQAHGGWNDVDSREKAERLCGAALVALDDAECRERLRSVQSQSLELFSRFGHLKWARRNMTGAEYLRLQILITLEGLNTRLFAMETQRDRSSARSSGQAA